MADSNKCMFMVIGGILGIGALLTVILVPMSFSSLEYYQYGFKKSKSTGTVNTKKVYDGGKYMLGPDYTFKPFKATAHFVTLPHVSVFTFNKLEIYIQVYFQYFLRKEDLPILHKSYDVNYESIIKKNAISALKAQAPNFKTREYIENRKKIEEELFKSVRERVGGLCCAKDCNSWKFACPEDCIPVSKCRPEEDKGVWADVKYFQLGKVVIVGDVEERYLRSLIADEETVREALLQEAQVIRKGTHASVKSIENDALEIREEAEAKSKQIHTVSQANYTVIVEKARTEGLKNLYKTLGITKQETKNSFDYLRTLRGLDNIHLTVDFQQRIVGGFN